MNGKKTITDSPKCASSLRWHRKHPKITRKTKLSHTKAVIKLQTKAAQIASSIMKK